MLWTIQCRVMPLGCQRACLLRYSCACTGARHLGGPSPAVAAMPALLMLPTSAAASHAACRPRVAGTAVWVMLAAGPLWAASAAAAQDLRSSAAASHRPAQACAIRCGNVPRDIRHKCAYKGENAKDCSAHIGTHSLQAQCVKLSEQDVAPLTPHHCMKHSDVCTMPQGMKGHGIG
jgi:hypothetical protein